MTNLNALLLTALTGSFAATTPARAQISCTSHPAPTENLAAQLAKFRPVQMPFSTTGLPTRDVQMVRKLFEAGPYLQRAFWRESHPEGLQLYQALSNCTGATEKQ